MSRPEPKSYPAGCFYHPSEGIPRVVGNEPVRSSSDFRSDLPWLGIDETSLMEAFDAGLLSFDPSVEGLLSKEMMAEATFIGRLRAAGCPTEMIRRMVEGLQFPFCYDSDRMVYDFAWRGWRATEEGPWSAVDGALRAAEDDKDADFLAATCTRATQALGRIARRRSVEEGDERSGGPPLLVDRSSVWRALKVGRDMAGAHLAGADLAGLDLAGVDLSGSILTGANLSGACLNGARLRRAVLVGACLEGADLEGADLTEANLEGVNLERAQLVRAILVDASLTDVSFGDFVHADLTGACLQGTYSCVTFCGCKMNGLQAAGVRFIDSSFDACDLSEADLSRTTFRRVEARGSDFSRACLGASTFQDESDFTGSKFLHADLVGATFDGCHWTDTDFTGADLTGALMCGGEWRGARLVNVRMELPANLDACFEDAVMDEGFRSHVGERRPDQEQAVLVSSASDRQRKSGR